MKKTAIYQTLKSYFADKPVRKVSVYGPDATAAKKESPALVVILDLEKPLNLLTLSAYRLDLENIFGAKVEIGTEKGISGWVYPLIESDIEVVFTKGQPKQEEKVA
jgi:predicted nucleotidyltransferase